MTEWQHGAGTAYTYRNCRCWECRAANAERVARRRQERFALAAIGQLPSSLSHGRAATYTNWGCRCDECRAANTERGRQRRQATDH